MDRFSDSARIYKKNTTQRFQVYVANRVAVIRENTDPEMWNHVSSEDNPADLLTRANARTVRDLNAFWFEGPGWLKLFKSQWPISQADVEILENDPEVKSYGTADVDQACSSIIARIYQHYSSWNKMQRALAWMIRWIGHIRKVSNDPGTQLSLEEIRCAKIVLIKDCQAQMLSEDVKRLQNNVNVKKSSPVSDLKPFLDSDGILRVGGRIQEHPIIIPRDHPVARAIVLDKHCISHVGVEWTLSLVRSEFWLVRGRPLVKRIIRKCVTCRKLYGKPCTQVMANLPPERIASGKGPFVYVGCDVFGPYVVKNYRSEIKRYGCVFTCLVTRAVHIEKLNSLDTNSFVNAIRRFIARRGYPEKIFSDNGTNFVSGEKEMKKALEELSQNDIMQYAVKCGFVWEFVPPSAPHWGGAWERMVGCIKRVLKSVLTESVRMSDEILETVFVEAECIVNGRPLTKLSDDPDDLAPLTPNHLLMLRQGPVLPPGKFDLSDMYRRKWRHTQHLADQFWRKFVRLYLPELEKRKKWLNVARDVTQGDLVLLLGEPMMPRNLWPLALVIDVSRGRDGHVRSARLRTRTGEFVRPLTKIILLEGKDEFL